MKLRNHQFSTQPRIFEGSEYVHPWYKYNYNHISLVEYYGEVQMDLRMKREEELHCPHLEDLTQLLKYQTRLLPSKSISRPLLIENLRQLEYLKIVIQAKLAEHVN